MNISSFFSLLPFYLYLSFLIILCDSANILIFAPGLSASHVMFDYRLASTLSNKGHRVTIFTTVFSHNAVSNLHPPSGIKEIRQYPQSEDPFATAGRPATFHYLAFQKDASVLARLANMMRSMGSFSKQLSEACERALANETLLNELKDENFDITIAHYFSWCPAAISAVIGVDKVLWVSPGTYIIDTAAGVLTIPTSPSYIPNAMSHFMDRMTFLERIQNTLMHLTLTATMKLPIGHIVREAEAFRAKMANKTGEKSLGEYVRDNVLTLYINGEGVLDYPRPMLPGMMFLGQMASHSNTKVLGQEWLGNGTDDGVILFSLGTVANTSMMPIEMKTAFLEAFKSFRSYKIIWKLDGDLPDGIEDEKHIKLVQWTPQRDLLYSGRVKLFITHGGYNSLVETARAGVPMILMPLFGDQQGNAKRAVRHGIGLELNKADLDAQTIERQIKSILTDPGFAQRSAKLAGIIRDKIMPNEDAVARRVDEIVRHRRWPISPARKLSYFQTHCLDVIFCGVLLLVTLAILAIFSLKLFIAHFCQPSKV